MIDKRSPKRPKCKKRKRNSSYQILGLFFICIRTFM